MGLFNLDYWKYFAILTCTCTSSVDRVKEGSDIFCTVSGYIKIAYNSANRMRITSVNLLEIQLSMPSSDKSYY